MGYIGFFVIECLLILWKYTTATKIRYSLIHTQKKSPQSVYIQKRCGGTVALILEVASSVLS